LKIVGLTGGIGSGKTTVSKLFLKLGVPVFYADDVAKEMYNEPQVIQEVEKILGIPTVLDEAGNLNKKLIAEIIFNNESKRKGLNNLIHPLVKERFISWQKGHNFSYCIREAAILIESGAHKDCDQIIVVTSSLQHRISRVMERDQSNQTEVKRRINAQMPEEERLKFASFIITNDGSLDDLETQVLEIHNQLL